MVLWGFPGETDELWAWTITPDMSPIFMGATLGGAGAYFFGRVFFSDVWHPAAIGIFAVAVFGTLMLIVTLIHWERFNHGDAPTAAAIAFYLWVGLYIAAPPLMGYLWWSNRRTDPGTPAPGDPIVPAPVRSVARAAGVAGLLAAAIVLLWPDEMIDIWPWELTPLTARVVGCFMAQVGVGALLLSWDERWSTWKLMIETFIVAVALILVGAARAWDDFDDGDPLTYVILGGLLASALVLAALYRSMETRRALPGPGASQPGEVSR